MLIRTPVVVIFPVVFFSVFVNRCISVRPLLSPYLKAFLHKKKECGILHLVKISFPVVDFAMDIINTIREIVLSELKTRVPL